MSYYLDTSAFMKLATYEPGSDALDTWIDDPENDIFSSDLLVTEGLRASRRISTEVLRNARQLLDRLLILRLEPGVFLHAGELDPTILRSLDAIHLAAALTAGDELEGLVTYDKRLADAAELYGVTSVAP